MVFFPVDGGGIDTILAYLCDNVLKSVTIRIPYPQITILVSLTSRNLV